MQVQVCVSLLYGEIRYKYLKSYAINYIINWECTCNAIWSGNKEVRRAYVLGAMSGINEST